MRYRVFGTLGVGHFVKMAVMALIAVVAQTGDSSGETYGYNSSLPQAQYYFNSPKVAVDSYGYVYVVNSRNQCVQKFTSNGTYQSTLGVNGVAGSDNSHFNLPFGVAVDSTGNIYVSDYNNQRIQKYNSNGTFLNTLGVTGITGNDNNHFSYPSFHPET